MLHSTLLFLNIGTPEMMLILGVAVLLFGGEKLPEIAKGLGKGIREFKDASEEVKREINNQINNFEEKKSTQAAEAAKTEPEPVAQLPEAVPTGVPNTMPISDGYYGHYSSTPVVEEHHTDEHHTEGPKTDTAPEHHEHTPVVPTGTEEHTTYHSDSKTNQPL